MSSAQGPRWLYMHGFASGPGSRKAVALADHFARRGVEMARLDGRVPSFETWRLSAMIDVIRGAIGDASDCAVVFGSSLGGLAAAVLREADLPGEVMRGVVMVARCAGLVGHLYEESTRPIADDMWKLVEREFPYEAP